MEVEKLIKRLENRIKKLKKENKKHKEDRHIEHEYELVMVRRFAEARKELKDLFENASVEVRQFMRSTIKNVY